MKYILLMSGTRAGVEGVSRLVETGYRGAHGGSSAHK